MRIAMISTPFVPVPPPQYGGTELIVSELVGGLTALGHEVTLFTCGQSSAPCEVRSLYDCARWPPDPYPELDHAAWAIEQILGASRGFDLVHAHIPSALPFARLIDVPMVYTVHHAHEARLGPLYQRANAQFVAISDRQRALSPVLREAVVIRHGLDPAGYAFGTGEGGYVGFLGRFAAEKGVHHAIDAASAAGLPLRLAGKPHWRDQDYFRTQVQPRLAAAVEAGAARLVGEVGGQRKVDFLRDARALLFPIEWEEPFGLVMIEAMLCGTPVVAFGRGSVPEVIDEGVTGFVCEDVAQMSERLQALDGFDRVRCRQRALERWSARRMVGEYERLYELVASTGRGELAEVQS